MANATRVTVAAFGVVAGLAGIEHGIGEILQGNRAPGGLVIESWPGSALFRVYAGEPAMTIVPNLLVTGILAVLVSLIFLVWATRFAQREHGGLVLILLSAVMLLVGAGFGPPLLGIILGVAATRIDAPLTWWRTRLSQRARHVLAGLWPWSLAAGLIAWLALMPGLMLLDALAGPASADLAIPGVTLAAFGLLLLTIASALAYDSRQPAPAVRASHRPGVGVGRRA